ncbi:hypothetical protein H6P81_010171 [Aristolochia fimbriata]|uniref:Methyltransferase-like protein 22 n=1 Tax=Aristolochia fimbriata TaxID=158543 RepID=A0AAV7EQW3_ARIFI|nr:hypothetical protein H6P81_010171 [Aristolochia fimbriata]
MEEDVSACNQRVIWQSHTQFQHCKDEKLQMLNSNQKHLGTSDLHGDGVGIASCCMLIASEKAKGLIERIDKKARSCSILCGEPPRQSGERMEGDAGTPSRGLDMSELVMSEVHLGCPPCYSQPHSTRFTFRHLPGHNTKKVPYENLEGQTASISHLLTVDEDGDLVLSRRNHMETTEQSTIVIQHMIASSIPGVGLQVWKAALVLSDFVLHKVFTTSDFNNVVACEFGAGTGLVSILLAQVAKTIFITDFGSQILDNCATNVKLNSGMLKHDESSVYIRELDWKRSWPPACRVHLCNSSPEERFLWSTCEINEAQGASLFLAADVIYSDDLTEALFQTLAELMSKGSQKVLYLALEKRYNFTLDDLNVVANGYTCFRRYVKEEEEARTLGASARCFVGKQIDLQEIPQYIREYDRGNELELWQIRYL